MRKKTLLMINETLLFMLTYNHFTQNTPHRHPAFYEGCSWFLTASPTNFLLSTYLTKHSRWRLIRRTNLQFMLPAVMDRVSLPCPQLIPERIANAAPVNLAESLLNVHHPHYPAHAHAILTFVLLLPGKSQIRQTTRRR